MQTILLESPFWLALVLVPVGLIALGLWNRFRTPWSIRLLLGVAIGSPLLFVLQALVETPREKLRNTVTQLSQWVESGDVDRIVALVAADADFGGRGTRTDFQNALTADLKYYTIRSTSLGGFEVTIDGPRAAVRCSARSTISTEQWTQDVPSRWEIDFVWRSDRWWINNVQPLEIYGQKDFSSFWDIPLRRNP